ncbi:cytochrome P450 [Deinococcus radiodurans]|nr:cytochrome P450 [Deinococcus radiodurans]
MGTIKLRPFLTRCYQAYGPVFQLTVPGQKITVLAGPEANLFAMKEGHRVLRSLEAWRDNDHEMGSDRSMISLDGAEHRAYRRVEGRAFARSFFAAGLRPALAVLAEDLAPFQPGDVLPVATWCKKTITEQLARMAVGGTVRPYLPDLLHFIQTALQVTVNRQLPPAVLRLPKYRRAKARIFQMVDDLIEDHRQNPPEKSGRAPDLIDDVLADQQVNPERWEHPDVRLAALGAFIAGMDTAANSLAFVLYRMHLHSEFLPALRAEADALFRDGPPTAEALGRSPLLHRFVMETLRVHPIAPALSRTLTEDVEFAGHRIPAGTPVIIGTTVPHGLPELFPDPEHFDPGRFAPGRAEHRQPGAYAPSVSAATPARAAAWPKG